VLPPLMKCWPYGWIEINILFYYYYCQWVLVNLHFFDTVGSASGRTSDLWKLTNEVPAWLSVWSKGQMICIKVQLMPLPSHLFCLIKIQNHSACLVLGNGNYNNNKLAPYGTGGWLLLTANFKVTWHKNRTKPGPDSFRYCALI